MSLALAIKIEADDDSSGCHSEEGGINLSDSEPKDSGVDCSSDDIPDEATSAVIQKAVEYYLSDANILKDPFLLKHVRRNKEGYVSLKLLASFRKVRTLCRSWKGVAHSLRNSKELQLNADGTKVKRISPLPQHDETLMSRSILVYGFESERPSLESISEMFSNCGDIALLRILRPGGSAPSEVKRLLSKNPELQSKTCALVEFEVHASAKKAAAYDRPGGLSIVPLLENPKKEESPKKKKKNKRSSLDKKFENLLKIDDPTRTKRSGSLSSGYLSSSPGSGSWIDSKFPRRHSYNTTTLAYNNTSSFASLNNRYNGSRERLQIAETESSGSLSPWRRRKEQMKQSEAQLSSSPSPSPLLVKAVRMPRGPDGTKGFVQRPDFLRPQNELW